MAALAGGAVSKYNNDPGSGRTGYWEVPPNSYDFYTEAEKYKPNVQADGGILSNAEPMYNPTPEQADADQLKAYQTGVPHGFVKPGNKYAGQATIKLLVRSELHHDEEYGGPFWVEVSPKMKVDDLRKVISNACGIMPGMQKLSFAGKNFEDSQRTLEQYGVKYWNTKFPHWPLTVRRN